MSSATVPANQVIRFVSHTMGVFVAACVTACTPQEFSVVPKSEEFGQKVTYSTDVDVLWVIDTSTSMGKHQNLLADQVGLFVDALNRTGLDYQIGVTTMDMGSGGARGRLLAQNGQAPVLRPDTPQLVSVLSERLRIGEDGSSVERGQEAMKAALSEPLSAGVNSGFLRQNSFLAVIFLTNEEDQSTPDDYAGFLDQIRPALPDGQRSWIAHFMGVVPNDSNCTTAEWGFSSPGYSYIGLAEESGGVSESICDADLRRALTNVKARILEVITEYKLNREPLLESIEVYVNDKRIPPSTENGWSYYEPGQSIRFHGDAVPAEGARIRVDFTPATFK